MLWDWIWTVFPWGVLVIFWGGIVAIAIVGIILGTRKAWRRAHGNPLRALGIAIWAIIPTWWTVAKIAPLGLALWSLDIVSRWDVATWDERSLVGLTLLVCGVLASFSIVLWHDKVLEDDRRTKEIKKKL
jgi:hypothetical protein